MKYLKYVAISLILTSCTLEEICEEGSHKEGDKCVNNPNTTTECGYPTVDCTALDNVNPKDVICEEGICQIRSCETQYVLKDNKCISIEDTTKDCGSIKENCPTIEEAKSIECNNKQCTIIECKTGFILNDSMECRPDGVSFIDECNEANENESYCHGSTTRATCTNGKWLHTECKDGCKDGECQEPTAICTAQKTRCNGNDLEFCTGSGWTTIPCPNGCEDDQCITKTAPDEKLCTNGAIECNVKDVVVCSNNTWNIVETCNHSCENGHCMGGETIIEGDPCDDATMEAFCSGNSVFYCDPESQRVQAEDCDKKVCKQSAIVGATCAINPQDVKEDCKEPGQTLRFKDSCSIFEQSGGSMVALYCEQIDDEVYGVAIRADSICFKGDENEYLALTCTSNDMEVFAFRSCTSCVMVASPKLPNSQMTAMCDGQPISKDDTLSLTTDQYIPCSPNCKLTDGTKCIDWCNSVDSTKKCVVDTQDGRVQCLSPCSTEGQTASVCSFSDNVLSNYTCRKKGIYTLNELDNRQFCANRCSTSYTSCDEQGFLTYEYCGTKAQAGSTLDQLCQQENFNSNAFCYTQEGKNYYTCFEQCSPTNEGDTKRKCKEYSNATVLNEETCKNIDGRYVYFYNELSVVRICPSSCNASHTDCL